MGKKLTLPQIDSKNCTNNFRESNLYFLKVAHYGAKQTWILIQSSYVNTGLLSFTIITGMQVLLKQRNGRRDKKIHEAKVGLGPTGKKTSIFLT